MMCERVFLPRGFGAIKLSRLLKNNSTISTYFRRSAYFGVPSTVRMEPKGPMIARGRIAKST